jgi:exopolyphosphatase
VLLDTVNMDVKANRVTEKDREVARHLIQVGSVDTNGLYNRLVQARCDVEGLSSNQLLRKDYKERTAGLWRFGMSSVPLLLDSWLRRDESMEEACSSYFTEKGLDILVVLLYQDEDDFRRQLVLCCSDVQMLRYVVFRLAGPLGLAEISAVSAGGRRQRRSSADRRIAVRFFTQGQRRASRKRIEPLLREILNTYEI